MVAVGSEGTRVPGTPHGWYLVPPLISEPVHPVWGGSRWKWGSHTWYWLCRGLCVCWDGSCCQLPRVPTLDHRTWTTEAAPKLRASGGPGSACSPKPGRVSCVKVKALTPAVCCQGDHCLGICLTPQDRELPWKNTTGGTF